MNAQAHAPRPRFAIRYSFVFRYQHERVFSIDIPVEDLRDLDLSVSAVRNHVEDDWLLKMNLLGDYLKKYEEMAANWEYWSKNLERKQESIRIVALEDA
ncbi:hypothetical protein [Arthrobacter sp. IK3]|uniref:hypothetical protein n=1 Tax=Arthrobacter sp. IK3 TaxID=3448169 RepID=UPI003EE0D28C